MKQTFVLIAAAIIGFSTPVLAQSDDNETEITVTNAEGKKEIIDLPVAMTNETTRCCRFTTTVHILILTPTAICPT